MQEMAGSDNNRTPVVFRVPDLQDCRRYQTILRSQKACDILSGHYDSRSSHPCKSELYAASRTICLLQVDRMTQLSTCNRAPLHNSRTYYQQLSAIAAIIASPV